jgi:hypothetical protein
MIIELTHPKLLKVLISINLGFAVYSTLIFLTFLKVSVWLWLFLNICAPTQFLCSGLFMLDLKGKPLPAFEAAMVPFLAFFGTGGLFTFPWTGYMLTSQFSHIAMTFLWGYIVVLSFKRIKADSLMKRGIVIGLILGILAVVILNIMIFPIVFSTELAQKLLFDMGYMI